MKEVEHQHQSGESCNDENLYIYAIYMLRNNGGEG